MSNQLFFTHLKEELDNTFWEYRGVSKDEIIGKHLTEKHKIVFELDSINQLIFNHGFFWEWYIGTDKKTIDYLFNLFEIGNQLNIKTFTLLLNLFKQLEKLNKPLDCNLEGNREDSMELFGYKLDIEDLKIDKNSRGFSHEMNCQKYLTIL